MRNFSIPTHIKCFKLIPLKTLQFLSIPMSPLCIPRSEPESAKNRSPWILIIIFQLDVFKRRIVSCALVHFRNTGDTQTTLWSRGHGRRTCVETRIKTESWCICKTWSCDKCRWDSAVSHVKWSSIPLRKISWLMVGVASTSKDSRDIMNGLSKLDTLSRERLFLRWKLQALEPLDFCGIWRRRLFN